MSETSWVGGFAERILQLEAEDAKREQWYQVVVKRFAECESMLSASMERIATLESLLKERDGGDHEDRCPKSYLSSKPCTCGHDAVVKYFAEVGR